jgi:protein TonB
VHWLGKLNLFHWLAISLLLHVSLISPLFLTTLHAAEAQPNRAERLRIEVFGMVANRQLEEKHERVAEPQPVNKVLPAPTPAPTPAPANYQTVKSPVLVEKVEEAPFKPVLAAPHTADEATEQKQQTISPVTEDSLQQYMARVARKVRGNLTYPQEARGNGMKGTATIAFTITSAGDIKGNSLRVQKSSGYAVLDSSALESAQVSAPFEEPPKEIDIAIAVSFNVERF